ncbi:MAG: sporulation integral membrane protein YtvI [Syntrophomonadaceae bacterium]|nr:sporulation integral membrane protein YtvI [Syntrophomonadaceae bacterium]
MEPELLRYLKILVKTAVGVLALVGIYLLFTYIFPIIGDVLGSLPVYFMPFILALLLALLIEPAISFMETRMRLKRGPATLLSMLLVLGSLSMILVLLVSRLIRELASIYKTLSMRSGDISQVIADILKQVDVFYRRLQLPPEVEASVQENLFRLLSYLENVINSVVTALIDVASSLPGYFIFLLIALVATYFIACGRPEIRDWFLRWLPESWEGKTRTVARDLVGAFLGWVKAMLILTSVTAILTIVGLSMLRVNYALTIGLLTGLLDILPILGPGTLMIPWAIISFITGNTGIAVGILVLYMVIVTVRYILEPRVLGDNIGLHPLVTLIALYVGLRAAGVVGIILGPALVVVFLACQRAGVFDKWSWKRVD